MSTAVADFLATHAPPEPGPADPRRFRVDHRRQRWYVDPLPACDLAPATEDRYPAVSTLKRAWQGSFSKRWTDGNVYDLDPLRVASYAVAEWDTLARLDPLDRVPLLARSAKASLNDAANRGTAVHAAIEALLLERDEAKARSLANTPEGDYWPAVAAMVERLQPEVIVAEVVAISREVGFGGTIDAVLRIDGQVYVVDWKTRGVDSNHGAYPAEAVQLGAYGLADYMVVAEGDTAVRRRLPDLAAGLVVSIRPDSFDCFPIDLDAAGSAAVRLVETWEAKKAGESLARKATGKPWPRPADPEPDAYPTDRTEWIRGRIAALRDDATAVAHVGMTWPQGVTPTGPWTGGELDAIDRCLAGAETLVQAPFPAPEPGTEVVHPEPAAPAPDPAETLPADDGAPPDPALRLRVAGLLAQVGPAQQERLAAWAKGGVRLRARWDDALTARTATITLAAVCCARHLWDNSDPEALPRAAIAEVTGDDPGDDLGAALAHLTRDQAERLVEITERFTASDQTVLERLAEHVTATPVAPPTKETHTP